MSFLNPLALVGLAAAAIPALLHLLERRTPPELEFPPLRYLTEAERRNARRLRLRHLLLLILRTALIVTVVLAAARPVVPIRALQGSLGVAGGAHEPTALVVILDNSPSSGAVVDGRPTLERLKAAAHAALAATGPADRAWLLLADGVIRAGSRNTLLAAADSATPGVQRLDLVRAVARAARLVEAEPLPGREVHVVSDLQRTALDSGAAEVPPGVRVLALERAGRAPPNRGIASVRVTGGAVAVAIAGTPGAAPTPLTVRVRGREATRDRALAPVGGSATLPLPPMSPGWWTGEVTLEPDELRADDRGAFAWHVAPTARVSADPGAGPFVAAALAVLRDGRRVADGAEVTIGERPVTGNSVVLPPADPALLGQENRALAARGVGWRFGGLGTPGPIAARLEGISGVSVSRRYRVEAGRGADSEVLATVNGEPWLVRDGGVVLVGSRLDTSWTALPASPAFVPFLDVLVSRVARGEAGVVEAEGAPHVEFRVQGADTVAATVYGLDARESDLTPAADAVIERALGARLLDAGAFAAERFAGTRRSDLSGLLLACALLVALVEVGVATLSR